MSVLFREVNKSHWIPQVPDDVPADCFWDLRTSENKLSVYEVNPDDQSTVERIVAALVLAHKHLKVIDFAWIEKDEVLAMAVVITTTPAQGVADAGVSELHRDVAGLTGSSLLALAKGLAPVNNRKRYNLKTIRTAINSSLANDWVAFDDVPEDVRKKL